MKIWKWNPSCKNAPLARHKRRKKKKISNSNPSAMTNQSRQSQWRSNSILSMNKDILYISFYFPAQWKSNANWLLSRSFWFANHLQDEKSLLRWPAFPVKCLERKQFQDFLERFAILSPTCTLFAMESRPVSFFCQALRNHHYRNLQSGPSFAWPKMTF